MDVGELDLVSFSLLDDRRIYVKALNGADIMGMYWALRDMTIILRLVDLKKDLDDLASHPYFNVNAIHEAYNRVINYGFDEVEFSCRSDPRSIITIPAGRVKKKGEQMIFELQEIMGKILNAEYEGTPVRKLVTVTEQHLAQLPSVAPRETDNISLEVGNE